MMLWLCLRAGGHYKRCGEQSELIGGALGWVCVWLDGVVLVNHVEVNPVHGRGALV